MNNSSTTSTLQSSCIANIQGLFASDLALYFVLDGGLLGSPIQGRQQHLGFFSRTRYFYYARDGRFDGQRLWTPPVVQPEIWTMAAAHFRPGNPLFYCITHFLLPLLPDPDKLFLFLYQDRPVYYSFIDRGILDTPIRISKNHIYYFDSNCIYRRRRATEWEKAHPPIPWHQYHLDELDAVCWKIAVVRSFFAGMHLEDCIDIFLKSRYKLPDEPTYSELDRLIQRIERPRYERIPENKNRKTFDRIRIEVDLPSYVYPNFQALAAAVRKHKRSIDQEVIQRLESDPSYLKYGVPINFLAASECTLRRDRVLEYIFELKK